MSAHANPLASVINEQQVEGAAIRLLAGDPKNDQWFRDRGEGSPADRWLACPEEDRIAWRRYARAVLQAAATGNAT